MTPTDVVRAFHAAFVARDVEALCALYADDAVNHQVAEEPLRGKAAIREGIRREARRAVPLAPTRTAPTATEAATPNATAAEPRPATPTCMTGQRSLTV